MRVVPTFEKRQRGCVYCLHMAMTQNGKDLRTGCPFEECLYRVLDKYKNYEDFFASEESKIPVTEFFTSFASAFDSSMPRTPNRVFSDGDGRIDV